MMEAAETAVREALREGATEAEAYVESTRETSVKIFSNRIKDLVHGFDAGVGIRVAVGKRIGFAFSTGLELISIREAVRLAIKSARAVPEDPGWSGLPERPGSYPQPASTYSVDIARLEPQALVEDAKLTLQYLDSKGVDGALLSRASISAGVEERAIVNSNGIHVVDIGTYAHAVVSIVIAREGTVTPAVFRFASSRVAVPNMERLVDEALEIALLSLRRAEPLGAGSYDAVYTSEALAELMMYTVLHSLNGENVVRGRSFYAGRLGDKVVDERITIVDDGLLRGGDGTWRFDGEGVPSQTTMLIEKGVLKGFIFDNYWARRAGGSSTGNAVRSYSSTPRPGFTNVVVSQGDAAPEELLEGRTVVIYSLQGAHTANSETGEYSVLANPAILYENGEPRGRLPGLAVSGNMYVELAERVTAVGKMVEKPYPGMILPWVRLAGIRMAQR